jgi:hypothetical protein
MPSGDTFSMLPVKHLLKRWLKIGDVIVDPFARNSKIATYTNDLNPDTAAEYHLEASDFCDLLIKQNVVADVVLFDPPYSPRQISELYSQIGKKCTTKTTQNSALYKSVRDRLDSLLRSGGIAISFGWNSSGFGLGRGYSIQEIRLIAHGGAHNDTIVVVEQKNGMQGRYN